MASCKQLAGALFSLIIGLSLTPTYGTTYNIYTPHNPFNAEKALEQNKTPTLRVLENGADQTAAHLTVAAASACSILAVVMFCDPKNTKHKLEPWECFQCATFMSYALAWTTAVCTETLSLCAQKIYGFTLKASNKQPIAWNEKGIYLYLAQEPNAGNVPYALYDKQKHASKAQSIFIPKEKIVSITYDAAKSVLNITTSENEENSSYTTEITKKDDN